MSKPMHVSAVGIAIVAVMWLNPATAALELSVSPTWLNPQVGESLDLSVWLDGSSPPLSCFSFSAQFDSGVLRFDGSREGSLFSTSVEPTFYSEDVDELGRPRANGCVLGFGTSVEGPGELAVLSFTALAEGASPVIVVDAVLRDVDRLEIPQVTMVGASIAVGLTAAPPASLRPELHAYPNPSAGPVRFSLRPGGPAPPYRFLKIYDAAGRLVRALRWESRQGSLAWDGRDAAQSVVSNGLYFAVLFGDGPVVQTRFTRIPR